MGRQDSDNVIAFPTSVKADVPQSMPVANDVATAVKPENKTQLVMKMIEDKRRSGLTVLQDKVDRLMNSRELNTDPRTEAAIRDLEQGLNAVLTHMEAEHTLIDYLKRDLVACIDNLEGYGAQTIQAASHVQTLIQLLVDKGVITHEEMAATWNRIIRPQLEQLRAQMTTDSKQ